MNILYLAHRIPFPPNKGDKIRSYHQLAHLAKHHRVWCGCFVDRAEDAQFLPVLRDMCEDVAGIRLRRFPAMLRGCAAMLTGKTITEAFLSSSLMRSTIQRWCRDVRFDAVVAFSSGMAPYALDVPAERRVLDLCDLDSAKWDDFADRSRPPLRSLFRLEGRRLAIREVQWTSQFDATLLITEHEAGPLMSKVERGSVHVVGNGVAIPEQREIEPASVRSADVKNVAEGVIEAPTCVMPARPGVAGVVGFVGVLDYRPNVDGVCWFVEKCWSRIREAFPEASFRIVGRSPVKSVRHLARTLGVEVVGGVDDLGAELRRFDVSVAPLRIARGLQNKVLEAMAWGKPVVLTRKASDGIAARPGQDFVVADGARGFADAVAKLLGDGCERASIGQAARRFVHRHHRWDDILRHFELIVTGQVQRVSERADVCISEMRGPHEVSTLPGQATIDS